MLSEEKKKEILSEVLYDEFESIELSTAVRYLDRIRHHLGSSFGESEMRDKLLELHRLVMESQNSERHSIEDISDVSSSIESALFGIIEEAEKLQKIMYGLDKALNLAWTRIEEEE
jgi:hypothetical protein